MFDKSLINNNKMCYNTEACGTPYRIGMVEDIDAFK